MNGCIKSFSTLEIVYINSSHHLVHFLILYYIYLLSDRAESPYHDPGRQISKRSRHSVERPQNSNGTEKIN